ncbi:ABC transporter substrate-binding protein [Clostridium intestinale]|uniref:Thiamine pyrimidine synthase n=2 Tax=Clostridium intestinale TaxID=36845 RepID=U2N4E5_9CLOT|nr:ABC transporter substrate-binding protein [Clostridium intestinale]ERK30377.1 NMT1/THI5-like protein [Clostridium intestinale URNW]QLY78148.1 ABC transporter substrate-binding protein [Clostridium intestinale]
MKKKLLTLCLSVVMMGLTLVSCGTKAQDTTKTDGSLDKVKLQLKWLPQSQFMGFYVAAEKGYYKDAGIEIELLPGGSDIIPEQNVYNGAADIGVTWVSSLMTYQAQGYELQEIAQVFQKSGLLLASKKSSGINSPADLKGKKVANWFGGNEYEVLALLEKYKLNKDSDLKLVQQDYTMDQLKEGSVDAASAMTYNEFGLLLESGIKESDLNVINMNDEGVAMLEDCLFVNSEWASKNKDVVSRFLKATIKGWQEAVKNPEAAGKIVYEVDKSVSLEHQVYMAKEVAKLAAPEGFDSAKIGQIDMDAVKQTAKFLKLYNKDLAKDPVVDKTTFTSEYWDEATK